MKKLLLYFALGLLSIGAVSCKNQEETKPLEKGEVNQEGLDVYSKPVGKEDLAGDTMPFYDEETGKFHVFYLYDNPAGVHTHHWNDTYTEDFLTWSEHKEVIPCYTGEDAIYNPEHALATGSVVKGKDGLYHAFYTGFNYARDTGIVTKDVLQYTEKVFHATSTDLVNWQKYPELSFYGGFRDFRDPCIAYIDGLDEYWLLVTTRGFVDGYEQSVIRRYRSKDLWHWGKNKVTVPTLEDSDIFYTNKNAYNMECSTIFKWKGYWYLTYSACTDIPNMVTRYRYMKDEGKTGDSLLNQLSTISNWKEAKISYINGSGWYAAKFAPYKDDRMIGTGWTVSKSGLIDAGAWKWGGYITPVEINQREDGTIYASPVKETLEKLNNKVNYQKAISYGGTIYENNSIKFVDTDERQAFLFEELSSNTTKMTFDIIPSDESILNITFGAIGKDVNLTYPIRMDFKNRIMVSETRPTKIVDGEKIPDMNANKVVMNKAEFYKSGVYHCTIIIEDSVVTLFIEDNMAFSMTCYRATDEFFGFYTDTGNIEIKNINFYE